MTRAYAKLPAQERAFIEEYIIDGDAYRAALRCGYTEAEARRAKTWVGSPANRGRNTPRAANRELMNPAVRVALDEALDEQARRARYAGDKCVDELKKIAFANIADFIGEDDNGTPLIILTGQTRAKMAALGEVMTETTTTTNLEGDVIVRQRVKIKLWDKRAALVDLMKHFGEFAEDNNPPSNYEFTLNIQDARSAKHSDEVNGESVKTPDDL